MSKISIKREQSQAGLSFAEREKFRPQVKNKLLLLLVLLMTAATGAWAQTETLLTTIKPTGKNTYSETTAGVVTVTPSNMRRYNSSYGWLWGGSGSVTVEAKEGYTITRCVFKQNEKTPVAITTSPFAITFDDRGDCVQNDDMDGVTSIEVYGNAPATGYSVTLAEGTEDGDKWTIEPKTGLNGGETVTATYKGEKKVKSVKAVKKGAPAPAPATITVTWNNNDITGSGKSFTKDGVTITMSSREIDFGRKNFRGGLTFTTNLGNFTKIEVTARSVSVQTTGTGWSRSGNKCTWTGNASSVSFDGDINDSGSGTIKFVFTIEPKN